VLGRGIPVFYGVETFLAHALAPAAGGRLPREVTDPKEYE
jgi:hypothetical protein